MNPIQAYFDVLDNGGTYPEAVMAMIEVIMKGNEDEKESV